MDGKTIIQHPDHDRHHHTGLLDTVSIIEQTGMATSFVAHGTAHHSRGFYLSVKQAPALDKPWNLR